MTLDKQTVRLSPEELAIYAGGSWDAYRIEDDVIEFLDRHRVRECVVVEDGAGKVLFGITPGQRRI